MFPTITAGTITATPGAGAAVAPVLQLLPPGGLPAEVTQFIPADPIPAESTKLSIPVSDLFPAEVTELLPAEIIWLHTPPDLCPAESTTLLLFPPAVLLQPVPAERPLHHRLFPPAVLLQPVPAERPLHHLFLPLPV